MSKVEDEVCELIQARAKKATIVEKYDGATMERDDLSHYEWLEHLQHELMDGAIYVQRLRTREQTLEAKLRDLMISWKYERTYSVMKDGKEMKLPRLSDGSTAIRYSEAANILEALLDEVSE